MLSPPGPLADLASAMLNLLHRQSVGKSVVSSKIMGLQVGKPRLEIIAAARKIQLTARIVGTLVPSGSSAESSLRLNVKLPAPSSRDNVHSCWLHSLNFPRISRWYSISGRQYGC
jgi:hypothetical protein